MNNPIFIPLAIAVGLARDSNFISLLFLLFLSFFKFPLSSSKHPNLFFYLSNRSFRSEKSWTFDRFIILFIYFEIFLLWHVSIRRTFSVTFTYIGYKIIDKNLSSKSTIPSPRFQVSFGARPMAGL